MSKAQKNFNLFMQKKEKKRGIAISNLYSGKDLEKNTSNLKKEISNDSKYYPSDLEKKILLNGLYRYFPQIKCSEKNKIVFETYQILSPISNHWNEKKNNYLVYEK